MEETSIAQRNDHITEQVSDGMETENVLID